MLHKHCALICLQKMGQAIRSCDKKAEPKQPGQMLLPPRHLALRGLCPDTVLLWVSNLSGCRKVDSITQDNSQANTLLLSAESV